MIDDVRPIKIMPLDPRTTGLIYSIDMVGKPHSDDNIRPHHLQKYLDEYKNKAMNQPPGNPTEIETKLADLQAEVIAINESIKNQDHVIWLAKVEKVKQKSYLEAALRAIEAITKPKE